MSRLSRLFGAGPKAEGLQTRAKDSAALASPGEAVLEAAKSGDLAALRALARAGADLDLRDKAQGWTALMFAIEKGYADAAIFLIESGANVNSSAETGTTALMIATVKANGQVISRLLQADVDTTAKDIHGRTALDLANLKLEALGQQGEKELADIRDSLSHSVAKPPSQLTSLDADKQQASLALILAQVRQSHDTIAAAKALGEISMPAVLDALLEVFRAAAPSRLDDDGVCVKRGSTSEGTHRVLIGDDDVPARLIVETPGVCRALRDMCNPHEYERLLIAAEGFQNPEWYSALVQLGTSRAAGAILGGWTFLSRPDDPRFVLGMDALKQLGPNAHDRLLRALERAYTQSWVYADVARQFRHNILVVLGSSGNQGTVERLRELASMDSSLSEDATSAMAAISQRDR